MSPSKQKTITRFSDFTPEEQSMLRSIQNSMAIEGFEISDQKIVEYAGETILKHRRGEGPDFEKELAVFRARQKQEL